MSHENLNRKQEVQGSSNRSFGLVFTVFFLVAGLLPLLHGKPFRPWALAVSGVFLVLALALPSVLALPNRLWTRFGLVLHAIVSPIALGILFYGVVTPMGILMRLTGKDPMRLKFDAQAESYWIPRTPPGPEPGSMTNQF